MKHRPRWLLYALLCCAAALAALPGAQAASVWGAYGAVLAEASDGSLYAAVTLDADTGARVLRIGTTEHGVFAETASGAHAVPPGWAADTLSLTVYRAQNAQDTAYVMVYGSDATTGKACYLGFLQQAAGWQFWTLQTMRGSAEYTLIHNAAGRQAYITAPDRRNWAPTEAGPAALEDFNTAQALDDADAAVAKRATREEAVFARQRETALADTPWASAEVLRRKFVYTESDITFTLAVFRAGAQTALCVIAGDGAGGWAAAVGTKMLPQEITADTVLFPTENTDDDTYLATHFSVSLPGETGAPYAVFARDVQGDWQLAEFSFWPSDTARWYAQFTGDLMKLYPGRYVGEKGYLYRPAPPDATAFATFDPAQTRAAMETLYADTAAGAPPYIPTDGTAYALPQPCGAALKKGTYAVYTGPGTGYYREAGGKAAVSASDWVQVFGTDGDWVLVQYRVKGALLRFGYIQKSALQNPAGVPALTLEQTILTGTDNEFVTSDPLGFGGRMDLPRGQTFTRLGTLGDQWMYVELTLPNGMPARMFAEITASHG